MIIRKFHITTIILTLFTLTYGTGKVYSASFGIPLFYSAEVEENQPVGTEVLRIPVSNDDGDTLSFRILVGILQFSYEYTDDELIIKTKMVFDYECEKKILVSPGVWSGPGYCDDQSFIFVDILNDETDDDDPINNFPEFMIDNDSVDNPVRVTVQQNTEAEVNIGTAHTATDIDGDTLTYNMYANHDKFKIDSDNGQVQTAQTLEDAGTYKMLIYVVDGKGGYDFYYLFVDVEEEEQMENQNDPKSIIDTSIEPKTPIHQEQTTITETKQDTDTDTQESTQPSEESTQPSKESIKLAEQSVVQNEPVPPTEDSTEDTTESPTEEEQLIPISKLSHPGQIGFSELMYATRGGLHSIAQWIELYNNSNEEVNLIGWKLVIEARDKNNRHRYVEVTLHNLPIQPNGTALIVTWSGRKANQITENIVYYFFNKHYAEFEQNQYRNMVIGQVGFALKLIDPDGVVSDVVGNLDGDSSTQDEPTWKLPNGVTEDGARSSLMRRYSIKENTPLDGNKRQNWVPSSHLPLAVTTYWGKTTDIGNPGHRIATPLPVELSYFNAEKTEEGIDIKWITESEIDNAGFNILRSDKPIGQFHIINSKLIQGAGTTGERNTYTWTDTTAKPNIEYYYQIEDVSFAGIRQTLSTKRMKGIFSAKNRVTIRWSELKIKY